MKVIKETLCHNGETVERTSLTELGGGSSCTMSFKEIYGFELDPEKIKDIDHSKTLIIEVDMRKINDKDYIKRAEENKKEVIEYLKGFAKEEEK